MISRSILPDLPRACGVRPAGCKVAAALNALGAARIDLVSYAAAGNCSAGGYYVDSSDHGQVFAVSKP